LLLLEIPANLDPAPGQIHSADGPSGDDRRHPIDHEHYVDKQLRAVAEPVLSLLGQDFADASGSRKQLSLF